MQLHVVENCQIQQFTWNVIDANSFLIVDDKHGLLIDAIDSQKLMDALAPLEKLSIILTHCHFDHICGLNRIRGMIPNTIVYATRKCSEKIGNPYKNLSSSGDAFWAFYKNKSLNDEEKKKEIERTHIIEPFACEPAEHTFEGETEIDWVGHTVRLLQCGGHSSDSLIAVLDNQYMFSGDTLLPIPTVTRFPSGSTSEFWKKTIPCLRGMSVELVFPGHGSSGNLEDMLAVNNEPERYRAR